MRNRPNDTEVLISLRPELDKAAADPALCRLAEEPAFFFGPIVIPANPRAAAIRG